MTVEQIISDYQSRGQIRPETADWLLKVYRYEIAEHGDEREARRVLLELLTQTPEQRRQKIAEARTLVLNAVMAKLDRSPVPLALRALQAVVGAIVGAVLAALAVFAFFYGVMFLLELIFGSAPSRVRVPVKGVLAALVAPIVGAVLGGLFGWKFDARVAKENARLFLVSSTVFDRAWIAWGAAWTGLTLITFTVFDPFERSRFRYWRDDDWFMLAVIWICPIIGGWAVAQLVRWVAAGRRE